MKEEKKYHNRELSWLEFNYRVLEEALDKSNAYKNLLNTAEQVFRLMKI
jgi:polyphosphate kinase